MGKYAQNTTVSTDSSRAEIERTLTRYGADQYMYGWDTHQAMIGFRMNGKMVKFILPLPDINDFRTTETGRDRKENAVQSEWEKAQRQRFRALCLVVKAKLEAVDSGITTFENEFLSQIVLPDGTTMGQWALPQIDAAYESGSMPKLLPIGD